MNIIIRKVEDNDREAFQTVRVTTWRSAYAHIFPKSVFDQQQQKLPEYIENMKQRLKNQDDYYYVAEVDGKVVAMMAFVKKSHYEHYAQLGYADLEGLYILPEYQGLGIGNRLFKVAVQDLVNAGCTKMVIGVLKDNPKARKAYERWGGILDTFEQPFEKDGKQYPEVFYLYEPLDKFL